MNEDVACRADDLTTAGGGQAWQKLLLGGGGAYEVAWDTAAAVTPMGSLVYFGQYLSAGGLLDGLVADCPLSYRSGNAPGKREVIGTTVLAILNGQTRYAHINALRQDRVSAEVLNVKKIVSELVAPEKQLDETSVAFALLGGMNWLFKWYDPEGRITPERLVEDFVKIYAYGLLGDGR